MSNRQRISTGFVGAVIFGFIAAPLWLFLLLAAVYRPTPSMIFLVLFIGAMLYLGVVLGIKERRAERDEPKKESESGAEKTIAMRS